jgi:hypothetical protein
LKKIDRKLDEINENYHNKEIIPVSAFVTFETAKGFQTCLKRMGKKSKKCCSKSGEDNYNHHLFGVNPLVKKAPDPSQIIWESYSISDIEMRFRRIFVYCFLTLLLLLLYISIFVISLKGTQFESVFP